MMKSEHIEKEIAGAGKKSRIDALIKKMEMISQDMKSDAEGFDGKPLNGKTIGTYFGYHGAAISALAATIKEMLENEIQKTDLRDACCHEWEEVDSQFSNDLYSDVRCVKCGVPGEMDIKTGKVFYPAT